MKYIAIDAATVNSGVAVFKNNKLDQYYVINISTVNNRAFRMVDAILNTIQKEKPDLVVLEGIQQQRSVVTTMKLASFHGAIGYELYKRGIESVSVIASTWRRICGINQGRNIKREELKKNAISMVNDKFGIDVPDDVAEAILLGEAYRISPESFH